MPDVDFVSIRYVVDDVAASLASHTTHQRSRTSPAVTSDCSSAAKDGASARHVRS